MSKFWKINLYISIITFLLFIIYLLVMNWNFIPQFFHEIFGYIFLFGPFLEVIQIPLCLIFSLLTIKSQKKNVWLYMLMMMCFFVIKIVIYFFIIIQGGN